MVGHRTGNTTLMEGISIPQETDQQQQQHYYQLQLQGTHNDNYGSLSAYSQHLDANEGATTTTPGVRMPRAVVDAMMDAVSAIGGNGEFADESTAAVLSSTHDHGDASDHRDAGVVDHGVHAQSYANENHGDDVMAPAAKRQRLDESGTPLHLEEPMGTAGNSATMSASQNKKVHTEQWNEMLERLKAYKAEYGDTLVPKRFNPDPKLGTWVETQRVQYKRLPRIYDESLGREVPQPNKRLTADRLQKLSDLGFCWSAKHMRQTGSTSSLSSAAVLSQTPASATDVKLAVAEESHAPSPVPQTVTVTVEAPAPAPAVHASDLSGGGSTAVAKSKAAVAVSTYDAHWDEFYERLVRFKELHGHTLVPRKYEADPKLGSWVETQRVLWNRDYNQSKDKEKISLPADSSASSAPSTMKRLSLERKEKLDALGFVWSLRSKRIEDHWDEMFKQLVEYKNQHGDCLVPSRYEENLKLGKWVETQRYEYTKLQRASNTSDNDEAAVAASSYIGGSTSRPINPRLTPERLRRLESIGFEWKVKNKMKRYYDKQWDAMFQKLLEFKEKYGHANVPKRYPENMKLGTWVHTQRIQYRKLMSSSTKGSEKDSKAGATGETGWQAVESHTNASQDHDVHLPYSYAEEGEDIAGTANATWTAEQAQSYRLTDARRKRLEEVGFCWSAREGNEKATLESGAGRITRNSYDDQWDAMFELLAKFKEEHGHTNVPKRYQANPKLGTWVDTQRVQYKKLQKKVAQLQHQKQVEANGETPMVLDDNGSVGSSGSTTSTALVGRLTQDRINRLQRLGFVWSLRDDWAKHYEELKAYKAIHGHCNVPARYQENRRLGIWVSAQRQQYKILQQQKLLESMQGQEVAAAPPAIEITTDDTVQPADTAGTGAKARRSAPLTQERIDLLNAIGFTWTIRSRDSLGESWNQRLHELRQFKQQHGHCLVPSRYETNPELGIWVGTQRTQYRLYMKSKETGVPVATSMNEDRIRELEEMGFVWALRGANPDETVAAAEAAAAAVEIADQVATVGASAVGHDSNVYQQEHSEHVHRHFPYSFSHQRASMPHEAQAVLPAGSDNTEVGSNHNNTGSSHNEYVTAI